MDNLDMRCAEVGQELASNQNVSEKLLTDALGVLEEQGLYAAFLYLKARGGDGEKATCRKAHDFLKTIPEGAPLVTGDSDLLASIKALSQNLDNLLLARDLVRQALVYARYHVKARS